MIVVCDINEVWRRKPFAALAERTDVLGVSPMDWFVARRGGFQSLEKGALEILSAVLPPSWASRTAWLGQRLLWKKINQACKAKNKSVDALVVTSPHYLPLLSMVPKHVKTFYYASDDYRSYEGWSGMAELEKKTVQRVDHSFFVSEALMERAIEEYGADKSRFSVSMNATEQRFFATGAKLSATPPSGGLSRPIAGVVGGINDRLDFGLLRQCADLPGLGTLLLVGPLPGHPSGELEKLLNHPKCVAAGGQPHETIHQWFQCLDVGLIPYVDTVFNRHCSPMRLFDHLASGMPLVATDACMQVNAFSPNVAACATASAFLDAVEARLGPFADEAPAPESLGITWAERAAAMLEAMESR
jgi:hypothetical protein